jgi:uncharacterized RDD family membrane protein YckC
MPPPPMSGSVPPGYQPYPSALVMNYASWGARVGGYLLNSLSAMLFALPAFVSFYAGPSERRLCTINNELHTCRVPTAQGWAIIIVLGAIGVVVFFVMYCRAVGTTGQFWGHRAAGVRIVNANDGSPIGAGKAFGRYLLHYLDSAVCYLGFLWPLWDSKKQTWADKIVGTVSVRV